MGLAALRNPSVALRPAKPAHHSSFPTLELQVSVYDNWGDGAK